MQFGIWSKLGDVNGVMYRIKPVISHIARFMGPTWGPPGSCRPQMGSMLVPWTLLWGLSWILCCTKSNGLSFESNLLPFHMPVTCQRVVHYIQKSLERVHRLPLWSILLLPSQMATVWSGTERWLPGKAPRGHNGCAYRDVITNRQLL